MGAVKEAVKGKGKVREVREDNLLDRLTAMCDDVSELTAQKDRDTEEEGDAAYNENHRKAGLLRAAHSLLMSAKGLLEKY